MSFYWAESLYSPSSFSLCFCLFPFAGFLLLSLRALLTCISMYLFPLCLTRASSYLHVVVSPFLLLLVCSWPFVSDFTFFRLLAYPLSTLAPGHSPSHPYIAPVLQFTSPFSFVMSVPSVILIYPLVPLIGFLCYCFRWFSCIYFLSLIGKLLANFLPPVCKTSGHSREMQLKA
jgi:hypothetical protein